MALRLRADEHVQQVSQQAQKASSYDLILSSGFLAFAAHAGFLQAVEDSGLPVRGVMGTSAGALIGSMYSAGYTPREIAAEFSRLPPIKRLRPSFVPWVDGGMLRLDPVVAALRDLLPPRFEDLNLDFACAVVDRGLRHRLIHSGACLSEAVAASAAVPVVFAPVSIPGVPNGPFLDGGIRDRIGLNLWRQHRYPLDDGRQHESRQHAAAAAPAVVHLIGRSSPFSGNDDVSDWPNQPGARHAVVVSSPRSGASLWDMRGFQGQFEEAHARALPALEQLVRADAALAAGQR